MKIIKIALVELGTFHDECLYSQLLFLQASHIEVTLIGNIKIKERLEQLPHIHKLHLLKLDSKKNKYSAYFKTWLYFRKEQFDTIIYNSAESNSFKLISLPLSKKTKLIGIIHNADKINRKRKQKTIDKKVAKYFVLNDFIKQTILKEKMTSQKVESFYPIFFPEVNKTLPKPSEELWVVVPGMIDFNKRDYSFIERIKFPEHLKIILLGRPNSEKEKEWLIALSQQKEKRKHILAFNSFIANDVFYQYIHQADYIMPLIHPGVPTFDAFLKYKISGSYNCAIGFKKTLLLYKGFETIEDFKHNAIFYNEDHLVELLEELKKDTAARYQEEKWNFKFQKLHYLQFILNP